MRGYEMQRAAIVRVLFLQLHQTNHLSMHFLLETELLCSILFLL